MEDQKIEELTNHIQRIVFNWTSKFYYHTTFLETYGGEYRFVTEFSLPTKLNPVPTAKVKVFFFVIDLGDGDSTITYKFEN
mmetsp:Transcript_2479/g.2110  ORF Transcript_2479/g.2110 Transcript_2479/m.2110 type:complete len:81 (+) Transcript_2479:42-284(+)